MKGWLLSTGQSVHRQGSHLLNEPVTGAVKHSVCHLFNNSVSQPDRHMFSYSVSHATKELIRQSANLSDRKPTSQDLARHYVCQPIKQQATLSDHQPGSVPALG
jgi:hypothetical protein